jgi:23S rRNA pseudouridine2605 synthase
MNQMKEKEGSRKIGLARVLSKLGYCSRARATELIRDGRVSVNGKIQRNPEAPIIRAERQVAVDGEIIQQQEKIYLMLNKPRGVVTTASDEKDRKTVYTVLDQNSRTGALAGENRRRWIAPVGRLDKASEGLLLLTNDSEWGARVVAPETHLDKTYHVQVGRVADEELIRKLRQGIKTKDGDVLKVKQARRLRAGQKNCWLEMVLDEGKNRHIRRMMEGMGIEVLRLVRVSIGPLRLGDLGSGQHRALTAEEKRTLDGAMRAKKS